MSGSLVNMCWADLSSDQSTVINFFNFFLVMCTLPLIPLLFSRSNRERDCVALLNTAIYKCPLANCKSMNGLAESLMLLSQGYISLGHLEDALHSICLAVDFASERYEDVSVRVYPILNFKQIFGIKYIN
jgi:hypothetical protein